MRRASQRGFTLLEVVVALAILGMSLTVLLQAQAASLASAGRSRDLTLATLLARGKMIDIEQHLFHDGFQMSTESDEGDFTDEGHPEIKWHYLISEVEFDLTKLLDICGTGKAKQAAGLFGGGGGADKDGDEAFSCEAMLGTISATLGGFTELLGHSLRAVELQVSWQDGKFKEKIDVRALLTPDDFNTEQAGDVERQKAEIPQLGGTP